MKSSLPYVPNGPLRPQLPQTAIHPSEFSSSDTTPPSPSPDRVPCSLTEPSALLQISVLGSDQRGVELEEPGTRFSLISGRVCGREIIRLSTSQSWTNSGHGSVTGNEALVERVPEGEHYVQTDVP